jgi:hypothetical protein
MVKANKRSPLTEMVKIHKDTKNLLDGLRMYQRERYDDIIFRIAEKERIKGGK